jgi:hypothetical protein
MPLARGRWIAGRRRSNGIFGSQARRWPGAYCRNLSWCCRYRDGYSPSRRRTGVCQVIDLAGQWAPSGSRKSPARRALLRPVRPAAGAPRTPWHCNPDRWRGCPSPGQHPDGPDGAQTARPASSLPTYVSLGLSYGHGDGPGWCAVPGL